MTRARYLVGDVYDRLREIPDGSVDLVLTSPPFLALRSYLPADHPDKHKEIGSEATPADFLDTLLALTAEWGRVLAPHGSICVELGDTYAGSGGAGGDYGPDGLREGQPKFRQVPHSVGPHPTPLEKSLLLIPGLYAACLAYGRNLLTGQPSPAGRWRIRNLVAWVRPNPPVGALGDKFRPATSYLTIACRARDRWFDLDAVRTPYSQEMQALIHTRKRTRRISDQDAGIGTDWTNRDGFEGKDRGGAPPLDWWNHTDMLIDNEIAARAGKTGGGARSKVPKGRQSWPGGDADHEGEFIDSDRTVGAQGSHIRRRLEAAGYLGGPTDDVWDIAPSGYPGAHYAVYPPELCIRPILAMCPRRVCTTCGQPSRRIVGDTDEYAAFKADNEWGSGGKVTSNLHRPNMDFSMSRRETVGWSECGHNSWRAGHVLDPFAGTGTTLAVATGHGRQATGIDLDPRNAELAQQRLGMFLDIIDTRESA